MHLRKSSPGVDPAPRGEEDTPNHGRIKASLGSYSIYISLVHLLCEVIYDWGRRSSELGAEGKKLDWLT